MIAWLPSLLPGGSVIQGVVCGLLAAVGYAVGAILGALVRLARRGRGQSNGPVAARPGAATPTSSRRSASPFTIVAWILVGVALLSGAVLSNGIKVQAQGLGDPSLAARWLVATGIGVGLWLLLIMTGRALRVLTARVERMVTSTLRPSLARVVAVSVVVVGGVAAVYLCLLGIRVVYDRLDTSTAGQSAPASPNRSGSAESLISWPSLGHEGRAFVTGGADQSTIRSFAGLESAPTPQQRADVAVRDMLRAGGGQAPVWIAITTTGNGQIDPTATGAADKATTNQAAMVAIQYSTLPSWLSFLVDESSARQAGIALYDAMAAARDALPAGQRPKLILYGESLGAYGSPAPFAGMTPEEVTQRIDGALWVGPPAATSPVTNWTYSGTPPVWQPIVDAGRAARYAASTAAVASPPGDGPWPRPRLRVLQNPTDPVVWFSPHLVWQPPAWLHGTRGPGVQDGTRWSPVLFFLQVVMDLPQAVSMPSGYGHNYADALPAAWAQVLGQ